jgi:hypothetical protein
MKKALISTVEPRESGYRVAQVVETSGIFEVAPALYWVDCNDNIIADKFWYNESNGSFIAIPEATPDLLPTP